jgi:hypothetical protein
MAWVGACPGGEALAVPGGHTLSPLAGGDQAEEQREDPAADQDGPGGTAGADELGVGAGHDGAGDGDPDGNAELAAGRGDGAGDAGLVGGSPETAVLVMGGATRPAPEPNTA